MSAKQGKIINDKISNLTINPDLIYQDSKYYKGMYKDGAALTNTHSTNQLAGSYAYVVSTSSLWVYDKDSTSWVDTHRSTFGNKGASGKAGKPGNKGANGDPGTSGTDVNYVMEIEDTLTSTSKTKMLSLRCAKEIDTTISGITSIIDPTKDAPSDNKYYVRKKDSWVQLPKKPTGVKD